MAFRVHLSRLRFANVNYGIFGVMARLRLAASELPSVSLPAYTETMQSATVAPAAYIAVTLVGMHVPPRALDNQKRLRKPHAAGE